LPASYNSGRSRGINFDVEFPDVFRPLFEKYRYKVYASGRGAGKSWSFARALLLKALQEKDVLILCVREVQRSIEDSVYAVLVNSIKELGFLPFFNIQATMITCRVTGSRFRFKGLFNERATDSVKSLEAVKYCWVEEAQSISQDSLEILIPTIREEDSEIWFSMNPRFREDAVWDMFFADPEKVPPRSLVKTISWRDNPFMTTELFAEKDHTEQYYPARYLHVWEGALKSSAGDLLKRDWWHRWPGDSDVKYNLRFVSADTAFSKSNSADFSVLQLWGITADLQNLDLLDSKKGRWNYPELIENTKDFYERHKETDRSPMGALIIENKASGQSLIQSLEHEGFTVYGYDPPGDKVIRVNASIPSVFHGRVRLPADGLYPWTEDFIAEAASFSDDLSHKHDDQVDAFTQAEHVWRETISNSE